MIRFHNALPTKWHGNQEYLEGITLAHELNLENKFPKDVMNTLQKAIESIKILWIVSIRHLNPLDLVKKC